MRCSSSTCGTNSFLDLKNTPRTPNTKKASDVSNPPICQFTSWIALKMMLTQSGKPTQNAITRGRCRIGCLPNLYDTTTWPFSSTQYVQSSRSTANPRPCAGQHWHSAFPAKISFHSICKQKCHGRCSHCQNELSSDKGMPAAQEIVSLLSGCGLCSLCHLNPKFRLKSSTGASINVLPNREKLMEISYLRPSFL